MVLAPLPRVFDGAVGRGHVGRAHRELVHVGLAQEHRAVAQQVGSDGAFVGRDKGAEDLAAGGGADSRRAEQVLDGQRDAGQRTCVAGGQGRVGGAGLVHRLGVNDSDVGIQAGVECLDCV